MVQEGFFSMSSASTTGTQFWSENLDYRSGILACFDSTRESVEVISLGQTPLRVVNWRGISDPVSSIGLECRSSNAELPSLKVALCQTDPAGDPMISILDPQRCESLRLPNPPSSDVTFGKSLHFSHGRLFVGEPAGTTDLQYTGKVWVLDQETGQIMSVLSADPGGPFDMFGNCIDGAADHIAIGAPLQDLPHADCGAVHIFKRACSEFLHVDCLKSRFPEPNGWFGSALLFVGKSTLLIGSPGSSDTGWVEVFRYDGASWNYSSRIFAPSTSIRRFGFSLAMVGRDLLVGEKSDGPKWIHYGSEEEVKERWTAGMGQIPDYLLPRIGSITNPNIFCRSACDKAGMVLPEKSTSSSKSDGTSSAEPEV